MEATGISHIAVCVSDMDKSLAFYRDILGMKISKDEIEDTSTGGLTHTYKHNRKTRRTVHIGWGSEPFLVMTSHPGDQADGEPIKLDQVGVSHLSFTVKIFARWPMNWWARGSRLPVASRPSPMHRAMSERFSPSIPTA